MKREIFLFLICLLLVGCQKEATPEIGESLVWETAPALSFGVLESEKLTVEPWYCGRAEFTGRNRWAETELGYYFMYAGDLYYADKANLANWVPVCNQPNCRHSKSWSYGDVRCNAQLGGNEFLIRNGRIVYVSDISTYRELVPGEAFGPALFSRGLDGTHPALEYHDTAFQVLGGGSSSTRLSQQHWLVSMNILQPDGSTISRLCRVTEDGMAVLAEIQSMDSVSYLLSDMYLVNYRFELPFGGERFYMMELYREVQGDPVGTAYCFRDGIPTAINAVNYATVGKYLAGDTLRLYRKNLGYYDLDLNTQQQTQFAEAVLPDASCVMPLPNCIFEMNDEEMAFFDGETWKTVTIPEEWKHQTFAVQTVASDRIFLSVTVNQMASRYLELFQIRLDGEEAELEYCGRISVLA